jgi:ubiquinone/menaquinone biosynthesis C-methylase UbiE
MAEERADPPEKAGLRNAWSRVAPEYEARFMARTAAYTEVGLDLLRPRPGGRGLDVACGPGGTTRQLAERLPGGTALGVDFAPDMVARARAASAGVNGVSFAVGDAERLSLEDASFDVVTCSLGLMYCYDARSALAHMARVLRPGGELLQVVWGRASAVWFTPVIELIETRASYYSAICPMMFFYGLPLVLPRMMDELGLRVVADRRLEGPMRFPSAEEAAETAIVSGPLAGLFANRLNPEQRAEVREAMLAHCRDVGRREGDEFLVPAEVALVVGRAPG